jgi:hypothetical protein
VNNPLGRLSQLLDALVAYGDKNQALGIALSVLLYSVSTPDAENMSRAIHDLHVLVRNSRKIISMTPKINQNEYLTPIRQVEAALVSVSPSESVNQFFTRIESAYVANIRFMAEIFSMKAEFGEINPEGLEELISEIVKFEQYLAQNEIEEDLKKVLWDGAMFLRDAVEQYSIYGSEGIRAALDRWYGMHLRFRIVKGETKISTENNSNLQDLWQKFEAKLPTFANLSQIASLPIAITSLALQIQNGG